MGEDKKTVMDVLLLGYLNKYKKVIRRNTRLTAGLCLKLSSALYLIIYKTNAAYKRNDSQPLEISIFDQSYTPA